MKKFSRLLIIIFAVLLSLLPNKVIAMTLEQAWVEAYQNNSSLEAQRAKLRATDEDVSQALSNWRPKVEAAGNIGKTYQYTPNEAAFGTSNFADTTRGYGVQVTQPIFRGFRTLSETQLFSQSW